LDIEENAIMRMKLMVKGNIQVRTELCMKENGKLVKSMAKESLVMQAVMCTKENGKRIVSMVKESYLCKRECV
jgi:hypothetical protein